MRLGKRARRRRRKKSLKKPKKYPKKKQATLKESYAKLAHLVASGATFVGHGLAQDFRMINIVVPPDQVVDTVHLFFLGDKGKKGEEGKGKEEEEEEEEEEGEREKSAKPSSSNNNSSRGRKLSLRFLVSRLLPGHDDFQAAEHDSVEDARAALALYAKWRELEKQGKLEETIEALYEYGRSHGFDPSANSSSGGGGGGVVFGQ